MASKMASAEGLSLAATACAVTSALSRLGRSRPCTVRRWPPPRRSGWLLELLKGVVGLAVDDGHRHVVVGADHEALGGDRSHGHVELAVADGAGAHDALGADLDGLVCLALVEDYVFGIGVEVALNGGAGSKFTTTSALPVEPPLRVTPSS